VTNLVCAVEGWDDHHVLLGAEGVIIVLRFHQRVQHGHGVYKLDTSLSEQLARQIIPIHCVMAGLNNKAIVGFPSLQIVLQAGMHNNLIFAIQFLIWFWATSLDHHFSNLFVNILSIAASLS